VNLILNILGRVLRLRRADAAPTLFSVGPDTDAPAAPAGCVPVSLRLPTRSRSC